MFVKQFEKSDSSRYTTFILGLSIQAQFNALKKRKNDDNFRDSLNKKLVIDDYIKKDIVFNSKYEILKKITTTEHKCTSAIVEKKKKKKYFCKFVSKNGMIKGSELKISFLLSDIESSTICKFHKFYDRIGYHVFFYDYEENYSTIHDLMKLNLEEKEKKKIFISIYKNILDGLEKLHLNNIVHCDLTVNHILVEKKKYSNAKICNFTQSQIIEEKKINDAIFGTVDYLPPESYFLSIYSKANDVWCLGICLYYFLFNDFPYKYSTMSTLEQEKIIRKSISQSSIKRKLLKKYKEDMTICAEILSLLLVHSIESRSKVDKLLEHSSKLTEFNTK